jgi:predicted dinucleotide-binding enzyme
VVGQTLAAGFIKHGYAVMIGSRDPQKLAAWKDQTNGQTGTFSDAAAFGDLLVLATKGSAALDALKLAGEDQLKGKVIIDTTNPIAPAPPQNGVLKFFTSLDESLMERLQAAFPEAHFVKAFSQIGNAYMVDPALPEKPTMFICGNDEGAKKVVSEILVDFGHDVCDVGKVEGARAIEPLCILWCIPGMLRGEWSHAFRLVKQ